MSGGYDCGRFHPALDGWCVYAHPPFNLIRRTLLKLRSDQVEEAIVILLNRPRKPWYPRLLEMTCKIPVLFRYRLDLLSQEETRSRFSISVRKSRKVSLNTILGHITAISHRHERVGRGSRRMPSSRLQCVRTWVKV